MAGAQEVSHMDKEKTPFGSPLAPAGPFWHPHKWDFKARDSKLDPSICPDAVCVGSHCQ